MSYISTNSFDFLQLHGAHQSHNYSQNIWRPIICTAAGQCLQQHNMTI